MNLNIKMNLNLTLLQYINIKENNFNNKENDNLYPFQHKKKETKKKIKRKLASETNSFVQKILKPDWFSQFPREILLSSGNNNPPLAMKVEYSYGQLFDHKKIVMVDMDEVRAIQVDDDQNSQTIGTTGLGPCIAIVGVAFTEEGNQVTALYHWSGPQPNQKNNQAAKIALTKVDQCLYEKNQIVTQEVNFFLLGSDEGSRQNLKALQKIGKIPKTCIFPMPFEVEFGWSVAVKGNIIYFGTEIIY